MIGLKMEKTQLKTQNFLDQLYSLFQEKVKTDKCAHLKKAAWENFLKLHPQKDPYFEKLCNFEYKLAEKNNFTQEEILSHVHPECKKAYLVFINGHLDLKASNIESLS